jgi:hypothetical protein
MKDDAAKTSNTDQSGPFQPPAGTPLKPAGNRTVRHEDKPPEATEVRRIHPRRPLPAIPESIPEDSHRDLDE